MSEASEKPRLGVFKFTSCDGCQLQLLNLDERLLALTERVQLEHFLEATSYVGPGPFDVALVEGSITTSADVDRIREIRDRSKTLVAIGACATSGGWQALRNLLPEETFDDWIREVYSEPDWIHARPKSLPIDELVAVDVRLEGCPVDREQLLRVLTRLLMGAGQDLPRHSVCLECKRAGHACVLVTRGLACLGPITRAGCGAICPAMGRDCYGCFGPSEDPPVDSLVAQLQALGHSRASIAARLRGPAGQRREFREGADRLEGAS